MKNYIKFPGIYAITPFEENTAILCEKVEAALKGGVQFIQYRDKSLSAEKRILQAKALRKLCDSYESLLLINDDIELAKICHADGVHLGQSDHALKKAREYLGDEAIIGITCHDSLDLAQKAVDDGADYISFGCFFPSKTKPYAKTADLSVLHKAKLRFNLPVVAIGGIDKTNVNQLVTEGADMLAICAGLFDGPDVYFSTHEIASLIKP